MIWLTVKYEVENLRASYKEEARELYNARFFWLYTTYWNWAFSTCTLSTVPTGACFKSHSESLPQLLGLHEKAFAFWSHKRQEEHGISVSLFMLHRNIGQLQK